MFGSLRLPKGGLSPQERQLYHGHFCSLCHALDAWGGKWASLLTNYDTTFWLLLLAALEEERWGPLVLEKKRCTAVPFRQVEVLRLRPQSRLLVSALTLALVGAKVEDDRQDGDRPWVQWAFLPLRSSWARAGPWLDRVGFPRDAIEGLGSWQRAAEEQAGCLEDLARPTQALLQAVFGFLADYTEQPSSRPALEELGRALGLWIYLFDAWTDQARDARSGSFNALQRFPEPPARLARHLLHALAHARQALAGLPLGPRRPLLEQQLSRLGQLTRQQLGEPTPHESSGSGRLACWVLGGLAAASLTPTASVACDGCDCGGCDGCDCGGCDGCDCSACECHGCDHCACGHCEGCGNHCDICGSHDSCNLCDCECDPGCCEPCCDCCNCNGSTWDVCVVCTPGGSKPKPPPAPPEVKEDELPGTTRVKRKLPWFRKKIRKENPPDPSGAPPDQAG